jgi:hypothetical protein
MRVTLGQKLGHSAKILKHLVNTLEATFLTQFSSNMVSSNCLYELNWSGFSRAMLALLFIHSLILIKCVGVYRNAMCSSQFVI